MNREKLLSIKALAERWDKDESSIRRYVKEGVITPCKGVPGMMFHPQYVAKLEGVELERFSPLQKRRLEREKEILERENRQLKEILSKILAESSKIINL